MELLVKLLCFAIFLIMQSIFINGVHFCFEKGNVFYILNPVFFEKNKKKWWALPIWVCIRCMASVYGTITYWPAVIYGYGFHYIDIPVFIFDVVCLTVINWIVYKKTN